MPVPSSCVGTPCYVKFTALRHMSAGCGRGHCCLRTMPSTTSQHTRHSAQPIAPGHALAMPRCRVGTAGSGPGETIARPWRDHGETIARPCRDHSETIAWLRTVRGRVRGAEFALTRGRAAYLLAPVCSLLTTACLLAPVCLLLTVACLSLRLLNSRSLKTRAADSALKTGRRLVSEWRCCYTRGSSSSAIRTRRCIRDKPAQRPGGRLGPGSWPTCPPSALRGGCSPIT
jgi:hypothetical protein